MAANGSGAQLPGKSLSKDLFQDMGSKVESINGVSNSSEGDSEPKVVEEIESLCMNCHADVSRSTSITLPTLTSLSTTSR